MIDAIRDVITASVRKSNSEIEAFIRSHLRNNRTTRLDIELVVSELRFEHDDGSVFRIRQDHDSYEVRFTRDVGIRQKLPCSWRPALPG